MAVEFGMDFTPIGKLGDIYRQGQQRKTLAELGEAFQNGTIDYKQAGGKLIGAGDLQSGLALIKLGDEAEAGKEFTRTLATLGQPGAAPSPSPGASSPVLQQPPGPQAQAPAPANNYGSAIAGIESGGKYDALGPVTKTGDRAFGKYQVMGANIPEWTRTHLGREMTPQEFLASPEAQDAVFKGQFGQYAQKYGPEGAARAWFAGEKGMNNPGARDQIGTSVAQYGQKFAQAAGLAPNVMGPNGPARPDAQGVYGPDAVLMPQQPQAPVQAAQADPGALPPNAQPTQFVVPGQQQQAPPRGAMSENPASGNIGILSVASANQRLPAAQRELAKTLLTKALDDSKLTDEQKEYYRTYVPQEAAAGRQPKSFEDYKVNLKRAGAVTSGETEFEKDMSKIAAKRWGGYLEKGEQAQGKLVDITQMREISQRVGSQGAWAGVKEAVGPFAEALGIDVKNLSDVQAYTSIIQRLAPQNRAPGSGSTSDIEFKGMVKAMPALIQHPAAREVTLDTMEAFARHDLAQGDIAGRLASKEITHNQAEKELRALPDPMKHFREWRKANPQIFGQAVSQGMKPPAETAQPAATAPPPVPEVGEVRKGHRFRGGDPSKQENWEPAR